jgi:hypothetical protein
LLTHSTVDTLNSGVTVANKRSQVLCPAFVFEPHDGTENKAHLQGKARHRKLVFLCNSGQIAHATSLESI